MIEIPTSGLQNSIQDLGRCWYLAIGVGQGGAMDRMAFAAGNALLGNALGAAGIEVAYFPFRLRFHVDTSFSVTGADCAGTLGGQALPPYWAHPAKAGEILALGLPRAGARAYVTFAGGLDVPILLGSRSTDQKTGFGGLHGRGLDRGDQLTLFTSSLPMIVGRGFGAAPTTRLPRRDEEVVLRALPAAETGAFDPKSRRCFAEETWRLTNDSNHMGLLLHGSTLTHDEPIELLSHGIVPGTVQVPPAGQPIIQMADANTCGGYPKIATVIQADHGLLAQTPIGGRLRFAMTDWL